MMTSLTWCATITLLSYFTTLRALPVVQNEEILGKVERAKSEGLVDNTDDELNRPVRSIKAALLKAAKTPLSDELGKRKKRMTKRSKRETYLDETDERYDTLPIEYLLDELRQLQAYQMRQNLLRELQDDLDREEMEETYELVPIILDDDLLQQQQPEDQMQNMRKRQYVQMAQNDDYEDQQLTDEMELEDRVNQLAYHINNAIYNRK